MSIAVSPAVAVPAPPKVDARLQPIVDYMGRRIELAMEKAAAHQADPRSFPLAADPNSMESLFYQRIQKMPASKQNAVVAKIMTQVNSAKSAREARLGVLAKIDLRSSVRLARQARAMNLLPVTKLTAADLKELVAGPGMIKTIGGRPAAAPSEVHNLELQIHKVRCVTDTNEAAKDEISIAGTLTNFATGETTTVEPLDMGQFKTGDVKDFSSPVRFPAFNLRLGDAFPKSYLAIVHEAEVDFGGFSEFLNKFVDQLADELNVIVGIVVASITAGAAAGSLVPAIGTIVGLVAGAVVGLLTALLKKAFADEIFAPQTVTPVTIGSVTDRFTGGSTESAKEVLVFLGFGGHYEVTVSWRLAA